MPTARATGVRRRRVVARQHDDLAHPERVQLGDRAPRPGPHGVDEPQQPADPVPFDDRDHGAPVRLERGDPLGDPVRPGKPPRAFAHVPPRADAQRARPDPAGQTPAGRRDDIVRRRVLDPALVRGGDDRRGDRVGAPALERRGLGQQRRLVGRVERHDIAQARSAERERAGLVERQRVELRGQLHVLAALDQHAGARGRGEGGDDRDRRRDHERARARDHEQHQRVVERRLPRGTERQRRHEQHREREDHDGRRVAAREAIHPALDRRAALVRIPDRADDAREDRVVGRALGDDGERALAVDGAREHRIPGLHGHRHALAGDRGLVDRARAVDDGAVERDAVPGAHDEARAGRHVGGRRVGLGAVAAHDAHRRRREIQQRLDGAPCPADAPALEQQRQREQERDRRGFEPFADRQRAEHGDDHEQVHVRAQRPERVPGLRQDVAHPGDDRAEPGEPLGDRRAIGAVIGDEGVPARRHVEPHHVQGDAREQQDAARERRVQRASIGRCRRGAGNGGRGAHPGRGDRLEDRLVGRSRPGGVHGHAPVERVEGEPLIAADERADRALQDADLLDAVESAYVEAAPSVVRGNRPAGRRCRRRRPGVAAGAARTAAAGRGGPVPSLLVFHRARPIDRRQREP